MANMSYCRFENTLRDLQDCVNAINRGETDELNEYEKSGLDPENIKKLIQEKKALYDYSVDQRNNKWSTNSDLIKVDLSVLPDYLKKNLDKYKNWIDE